LFNFKKENFTTKSLLGSQNDKVAALFGHRMFAPPTSTDTDHILSPIAAELLGSIILSARCQTGQQLLLKLLSPIKRTRSHVRRGLLQRIEEQLRPLNGTPAAKFSKASKEQFSRLKKTVRQRIKRKDYGSQICQRIFTLTDGKVNLDLSPSRKVSSSKSKTTRPSPSSIEAVFPKSRYVSPLELKTWQKYHDDVQTQQKQDQQFLIGLERDLELDFSRNILPRQQIPTQSVATQELLELEEPTRQPQEHIAVQLAELQEDIPELPEEQITEFP
jgi:hypothetical protein